MYCQLKGKCQRYKTITVCKTYKNSKIKINIYDYHDIKQNIPPPESPLHSSSQNVTFQLTNSVPVQTKWLSQTNDLVLTIQRTSLNRGNQIYLAQKPSINIPSLLPEELLKTKHCMCRGLVTGVPWDLMSTLVHRDVHIRRDFCSKRRHRFNGFSHTVQR